MFFASHDYTTGHMISLFSHRNTSNFRYILVLIFPASSSIPYDNILLKKLEEVFITDIAKSVTGFQYAQKVSMHEGYFYDGK